MYRCGTLQAKLCDGGSLWPRRRKGSGAGYQVHLEGHSPWDHQAVSIRIQRFAKSGTALRFGQQEQRRFPKSARHV